ncbi:hypothetical protein J7E93_10000 [Streptomyces sp. ISL-36]|uniref:hypothetical protein n=1 Tax=Streptomyces sp. ISL-36 TaxID=2819182 RepID=UPI001BE5FDFA|nr:hypothetical protein [Streptomyces sp. ISL-36]MBT2440436.1 hypothetical protein [Streptomyces sp. ISL-36]
MGWTVLYIAFGVVALWLLGEVLLQYKARLRWRVLAFCGFLGVVLGVLLPSVAVIIAGALAFAVGQTYVTLSFRRGFSTGWAIGGNPGASRRRRSAPPAETGPTLEVTDLSYEPVEPSPAETTAIYEPQPLPDETGQYGVYDPSYAHAEAQPEAQPAYDAAYASGYDAYAPGYEQPAYDYGNGQQQYAAYSDPYIGPGTDGQQYTSYDYGTGGQQPYADPYAASYTYDTPPGGVWVPQQRDAEQPAEQPQQPGQEYYGYGNDQQYRY